MICWDLDKWLNLFFQHVPCQWSWWSVNISQKCGHVQQNILWDWPRDHCYYFPQPSGSLTSLPHISCLFLAAISQLPTLTQVHAGNWGLALDLLTFPNDATPTTCIVAFIHIILIITLLIEALVSSSSTGPPLQEGASLRRSTLKQWAFSTLCWASASSSEPPSVEEPAGPLGQGPRRLPEGIKQRHGLQMHSRWLEGSAPILLLPWMPKWQLSKSWHLGPYIIFLIFKGAELFEFRKLWAIHSLAQLGGSSVYR